MFSSNKKLDPNLRSLLYLNNEKKYRILVKYKVFQDSILNKIISYKGSIIRQIECCNIICASLDSKGIDRLSEYPEIDYISLDNCFSLCGMSVSSANKVRISTSLSLSGKGITVGIIDSGVYPHKDLTLPYNRINFFCDLINDFPYPYDDNGHGTSICGIIAGNGEASNEIYVGVAKSTSICCFKAFDKTGKGFVSDVLFALQELIKMSSEHNIKVLCLPFETLYFDSFIFNNFNTLLQLAIKEGLTPVVPSGSNINKSDSLTGIALSKNCLTISGIDTTSKIISYPYSSAGSIKKDKKPDFCAACVDIMSLNTNTSFLPIKNSIRIFPPKLTSSYRTFTGTSAATAYISGICCLLYELDSNLTFDDILSLLKLLAIPLDIPKNQQGLGRININKIKK